MKISLIICSFLVAGLSAAPAAIAPTVINGAAEEVQHAAVVFAVMDAIGAGLFGAGSIITERHILTAASLVAGSISCNVGYGGSALGSLPFRVVSNSVITHTEFDRPTLANDIAIIVLSFANAIVFSDTVRAIALPSAAPGAAVQGSLAAFGTTQSNGEISQTLLVASLVTADISVCSDHFGSTFDTHFCAIGRDGIIPGLISNSCPGDNGAAFYTGDGFITTTTTTPAPIEEGDEEDEEVIEGEGAAEGEEDEGTAVDEEAAVDAETLSLRPGNKQIRRPNKRPSQKEPEEKSTENVIQQVEPELVGIASALGDFWVCNPTDPRAYTNVFLYVEWIQNMAGINPNP